MKFTLFSVIFALFKTANISMGFCNLVNVRPYIKIGLCFIEYMQLGKIKPGQIRQSVNQSI